MKILFVSNLFPDQNQPYRGLDNVTVLHHLKHLGHEIRVIAPRPSLLSKSFQPRAEDVCFDPAYLPVRYVPKLGGLFNHRLMARALQPALARLQKTWRWDVVLGSWLFPDGWAICRAASRIDPAAPVTLIAQGSDVHQYLKHPFRRKAILEACDTARFVITRSRSLGKKLVEHGVSIKKVRPIHNGVDIALFRDGGAVQARQQLRLDAAEPWLLFVGNLLPVKDPMFLIDAFHRLHSRAAGPINLALAGHGPLRKKLEAKVNQLGLTASVRFLGPLKAAEIATWMQAANTLCLTSVNEGLPNVILEAQACGLPVVATRVGGIHEVIDEPWKGSLTPPGDLIAWTDAVADGLKRPRERDRLSQLGMSRTWPAAATQYQEALQLSLAQSI